MQKEGTLMRGRITDIHMHVIPGVDDGSRTLDESCEMLRLASAEGIEAVFATPHDPAFLNEDVRAKFRTLQQAAQDRAIPVELHLGCELRISADTAEECVRRLLDGTYPTMGVSRCVLSEFTFGTELENYLYCIKMLSEYGFSPIIAHLERYPGVDLGFAEALHDAGALIQINVYSVAEEKNAEIRQRAHMLLSARLVDFFGTDAHRTDHRPPLFRKGIDEIRRLYTDEYASLVAVENPRKYLMSLI